MKSHCSAGDAVPLMLLTTFNHVGSTTLFNLVLKNVDNFCREGLVHACGSAV